ncbi:MAG TPA: hypothetical protein PKN27_08980 [Propionibacteriaceae bacterium]|nr:hypothetical protein [Propionibacteriaceae bacterium]
MATQFEFRLIDGNAADGELEADQLIAIVQSLKEVATKLGRGQTDAEAVGRPSKRTQHVAKLSIGLAPGSTRVLVRRAEVDADALPIELDEERAFDDQFLAIIESIAVDERPTWVPDTLAAAAGKLRSALEGAAPTVEFMADARVCTTFKTTETHKETWSVVEFEPRTETVAFVGRLRVVNLDTHRLQVTDDVGNKVALPHVVSDATVGRLLDEYVTVVGTPERDAKGRLAQIHEAVIEPAHLLPAGVTVGLPVAVSLEDMMASAPGPTFGGIQGLTDEEADGFLDALGL